MLDQMATTPYRILAIGDSVMWGQGLLDQDKLVTRVQAWIQQFHPTFDVQKTILAHSGAIIGVGSTAVSQPLDGEVPSKFPTILNQVQSFPGSPQDVDLVLMNGGINDVGISQLVNPHTDDQELKDNINKHCHLDLRELLIAAGQKFTKAETRIVVTGYYPILSHDSNPVNMISFVALWGVNVQSPFMVGNPFFKIAEQTLLFWNESTARMQDAVNDANAFLGGAPRIFFVKPQFTTQNSAFAPNPFVFGLNPDTGSQDSQSGHRQQVCRLQEPDLIQREFCFRASAGHPNPLGAERYFNDTFPILQTFGL
jgi:hypothetical protein